MAWVNLALPPTSSMLRRREEGTTPGLDGCATVVVAVTVVVTVAGAGPRVLLALKVDS